ncbi:MAG: M56 family metallopeptidase [Gammaproteobacteria bacterium]
MHLGWALIHFLWQGALVAVIYLCLRHALRHSKPQSRYTLALAALFVLTVLPLFTFFYLSGWHTGHPLPTAPLSIHFTTGATNVAHAAVTPMFATRFAPPVSWAVILWLAGVAIMGARAIWGWRQSVLMRLAPPATLAHPWQALLQNLIERMHIKRVTRLLASVQVHAPMVVGWFKPVILIPPSAVCGLSWQQAEMILAHELAHIRRHDHLFNLFQVGVETLLFYHPAVHWISRNARTEREFCCDDVVIETCGDRVGYLKALAELESRRLHAPFALASTGGTLLSRAYRVALRPEPVSRLPAWSVALLASAALITATILVHPHGHTPAFQTNTSSATQSATRYEFHSTPIRAHQTDTTEPKRLAGFVLTSTRLAPPAMIETSPIKPLRILPVFQPIRLTDSLPAPQPAAPSAAEKPAAPAISVVATQPLAEPAYPYQALRGGLNGAVQAVFRINQTGHIKNIRTTMVAGPPAMATAVRQALENWGFNPVRFNGKIISPQVSLTFVFEADHVNKPTGNCTMVTGSHVCHWYKVGIQDAQVQEPRIGIAHATALNNGENISKGDMVVKLAGAPGENGLVCQPQDACFLTRNAVIPESRQSIEDQFRLLSMGLGTGGS